MGIGEEGESDRQTHIQKVSKEEDALGASRAIETASLPQTAPEGATNHEVENILHTSPHILHHEVDNTTTIIQTAPPGPAEGFSEEAIMENMLPTTIATTSQTAPPGPAVGVEEEEEEEEAVVETMVRSPSFASRASKEGAREGEEDIVDKRKSLNESTCELGEEALAEAWKEYKRKTSRKASPSSNILTRAQKILQSSLNKTVMCVFNARGPGMCLKGDSCSFAHSRAQLVEAPNLQKTSMCWKVTRYGYCTVNAEARGRGEEEKCPYAHSVKELYGTAAFFKTKLCRYALPNRGKNSKQCVSGDTCRYAHSLEELKAAQEDTFASEGGEDLKNQQEGSFPKLKYRHDSEISSGILSSVIRAPHTNASKSAPSPRRAYYPPSSSSSSSVAVGSKMSSRLHGHSTYSRIECTAPPPHVSFWSMMSNEEKIYHLPYLRLPYTVGKKKVNKMGKKQAVGFNSGDRVYELDRDGDASGIPLGHSKLLAREQRFGQVKRNSFVQEELLVKLKDVATTSRAVATGEKVDGGCCVDFYSPGMAEDDDKTVAGFCVKKKENKVSLVMGDIPRSPQQGDEQRQSLGRAFLAGERRVLVKEQQQDEENRPGEIGDQDDDMGTTQEKDEKRKGAQKDGEEGGGVGNQTFEDSDSSSRGYGGNGSTRHINTHTTTPCSKGGSASGGGGGGSAFFHAHTRRNERSIRQLGKGGFIMDAEWGVPQNSLNTTHDTQPITKRYHHPNNEGGGPYSTPRWNDDDVTPRPRTNGAALVLEQEQQHARRMREKGMCKCVVYGDGVAHGAEGFLTGGGDDHHHLHQYHHHTPHSAPTPVTIGPAPRLPFDFTTTPPHVTMGVMPFPTPFHAPPPHTQPCYTTMCPATTLTPFMSPEPNLRPHEDDRTALKAEDDDDDRTMMTRSVQKDSSIVQNHDGGVCLGEETNNRLVPSGGPPGTLGAPGTSGGPCEEASDHPRTMPALVDLIAPPSRIMPMLPAISAHPRMTPSAAATVTNVDDTAYATDRPSSFPQSPTFPDHQCQCYYCPYLDQTMMYAHSPYNNYPFLFPHTNSYFPFFPGDIMMGGGGGGTVPMGSYPMYHDYDYHSLPPGLTPTPAVSIDDGGSNKVATDLYVGGHYDAMGTPMGGTFANEMYQRHGAETPPLDAAFYAACEREITVPRIGCPNSSLGTSSFLALDEVHKMGAQLTASTMARTQRSEQHKEEDGEYEHDEVSYSDQDSFYSVVSYSTEVECGLV